MLSPQLVPVTALSVFLIIGHAAPVSGAAHYLIVPAMPESAPQCGHETLRSLEFTGNPSTNASQAKTRDSLPVGRKSVLVLRLRSATRTTRCSVTTMNKLVFTEKRTAIPHSGSIASYFFENSYGRTSMAGRVVGPYTVDMSVPCTLANLNKWADAADVAAQAEGVNVSSFNSTVYLLPPESSTLCSPWGGEWDKSRVWMRDDQCDSKHILSHELGKSVYGAHRAAIPGEAFGDASTTMGGLLLPADIATGRLADSSTFDLWNTMAQFNAPGKIDLGWLPTNVIRTVTVGGQYKVALLEKHVVNDIQVLRIHGANGVSDFYISYRRAVGFDSDLRAQYREKTSVHTDVHIDDHAAGPGNHSTLLANLADGQSFTDASGLTVMQVRHDATYAYLTISFSTPR